MVGLGGEHVGLLKVGHVSLAFLGIQTNPVEKRRNYADSRSQNVLQDAG